MPAMPVAMYRHVHCGDRCHVVGVRNASKVQCYLLHMTGMVSTKRYGQMLEHRGP